MQDNRETNPEILLAQARLRRNQSTLNIELGLANRATIASGGSNASSVGGGVSGSLQVIQEMGGGDGGSGGGEGRIECFSGTTLITMANSDRRPIFAVASGLSVSAPDEVGKICEGHIVGKSEKFYREWLRVMFADKRFVEVRPEHRYRTEAGQYAPISEIEHVMHFVNGVWQKTAVVERARIQVQTERLFYNLEVAGYATYIANGDWVSNVKIAD